MWKLVCGLSVLLLVLCLTLLVLGVININNVLSVFKKELKASCQQNCASSFVIWNPQFFSPSYQIQDLRQLYYWHDRIFQGKQIRSSKLHEIFYSKNDIKDPPICVVFEHQKITYVIFRGTKTKQEVEVDLTLHQVPWGANDPDELVHAGFGTLYSEIRPQLVNILQQNLVSSLVVFGHSLGGALVNLCYDDLTTTPSFSLPENFLFFASAPPRVFSPKVADRLEEADRLIQVVNDADLIPSMPPSVVNLGRHRGTFYYKGLHRNRLVVNQGGKTWMDAHVSLTYSEALKSLQLTNKSRSTIGDEEISGAT